MMRVVVLVLTASPLLAWHGPTSLMMSSSSSSYCYRRSSSSASHSSAFWGSAVVTNDDISWSSASTSSSARCNIYMRKQKASDKRTSRQQRGGASSSSVAVASSSAAAAASVLLGSIGTMTRSPMQGAVWNQKQLPLVLPQKQQQQQLQRQQQQPYDVIAPGAGASGGGRGRSRKRATGYQILAHYQNHFLTDLTNEYKAEEDVILQRILYGDPIQLERSGSAVLFDMMLAHRGRLYTDHVYRLTKAAAKYNKTTTKPDNNGRLLHHTFRNNDILLLTKQPHGVGDIYGARPLKDTTSTGLLEARILNQGPTYIDIVLPELLAETDESSSSSSSSNTVYRVDQFISPVPYQRMVNALSQLTAVVSPAGTTGNNNNATSISAIRMDNVIREAIVSTYAFTEAASPLRGDPEVCQVAELVRDGYILYCPSFDLYTQRFSLLDRKSSLYPYHHHRHWYCSPIACPDRPWGIPKS
jgi:hypothetical protein